MIQDQVSLPSKGTATSCEAGYFFAEVPGLRPLARRATFAQAGHFFAEVPGLRPLARHGPGIDKFPVRGPCPGRNQEPLSSRFAALAQAGTRNL
ncbi:hypothetical protein PtA15_1A550 [Puccinia triticina]|uniref:Uncharacterized protein n=1 Tax=Puccinia triticina TaxID=208348 RepID=A0ABY7C8T2_9BASI|nr:uncharacterized protein PtA15_1A550 [Puccinia triticina]WAQ81210.1 hypothetical protein PtA15_1A550 [Puccinia triticina]WAR52109.1 hypothetical protein PtB15_1B548 [Puccinia triticina]